MLESPAALVALLLVLVLLGVVLIGRSRRRAQPAAGKSREKRPTDKRGEALDTVAAWPPEVTRVVPQAERKALAVLRDALPDHLIFAQVPISRFVKVPTRNSYTEWMRRVGQVCVDFVVCDDSAAVVAVVELRRPDHAETDKARRRHARMDRVLKAAGVPLHTWREGSLPPATLAREMLLNLPGGLQQGDGQASISTQAMRPAVVAPRPAPVDFRPTDVMDEATEMRDPPASTWFDDLPTTERGNLEPVVLTKLTL